MQKSMVYSTEFKERMIARMLPPENISATALSEEVGVSQTALSGWLRKTRKMALMGSEREKPTRARRPQDWKSEEKLRAVLETASLSEEELGEYLRRNGLHETDLSEWREEAQEGLSAKKAKANSKRIRELERELRRKEKALAEAAALLVLRKKVQALWGDEDDSTGPSNED